MKKKSIKKKNFKSTGNKIGEFTKDELELVSPIITDSENTKSFQDINVDSESDYVSELEKAIQFINDNMLETARLRHEQHRAIKRI